jgi:altronate hydrolase
VLKNQQDAAEIGGTSPIVGVSDYGEYITKPGLNLLYARK